MPDQSDRSLDVRALNQHLFEAQDDVPALLALLEEIQRGIRDHLEEDWYDLLSNAYRRLREATVDAPDQAELMILAHLLPWLIAPDQPEAANYARSTARETLREWLDQYGDRARARLTTLVLDALHEALLGQRIVSIEALCWTIGAVGHRRRDLVRELWRKATEDNTGIGDAALRALARLGLAGAERRRLLAALHSRLGRHMDPILIGALAALADPSSIAPLREGLEAHLEDPEPSFAHEYGLQTLADIAAAHPEDATLQERVWSAILALYRRAPARSAFSVYLGSGLAPKCDTHHVVPDLLELVAEHPGDDDGAVHRRRLLYLRISDCTRPRQLAGAGSQVAPAAVDLLHQDADRNTRHNGRFATSESLSKETAWTTLFQRGDPIVLTPECFAMAVTGEDSAYLRGSLMEQLAAFRWIPLPPGVASLITEQVDFTRETISEGLAVRKGATLIARSAATREAFEVLLSVGFTFQHEGWRDSGTALASVALRLARQGEPGIADSLIAATSTDRERVRKAAAFHALAVLAGDDMLAPHHVNVMLDVVEDRLRDASDRRGALEVLGALPSHRLEERARVALRRLVLSDDELAPSALEALAQNGALIEMPDVIAKHLPLYAVDVTARHRDTSETSSGARVWELAGTVTNDWAIRIIAGLYAQATEGLSPAMTDLVNQATRFELMPLLWALEVAHGERSAAGERRRPLPPPVRRALLARLRSRGNSPFGEPEEIIRTMGRIAPTDLMSHEWTVHWSSWSWRARQVLADVLGSADPSVVGETAQAEVANLLLLLARDEQYGVRRAAYRSLARISAPALWLACTAWSASSSVALRRRAAESLTWLPPGASLTSSTNSADAPDSDQGVHPRRSDRIATQMTVQTRDWDDHMQAAIARIEVRLSTDSDPLVRAAAAHARDQRYMREWAHDYFRRVIAVCDHEGANNPAFLSTWRYGHALVQVGDDEVLEALAERLGEGKLEANAAQWLRSLHHELGEAWKTRSEKWPQAWPTWTGSFQYTPGTISWAEGPEVQGRLLLIDLEPESLAAEGTERDASGCFLPDRFPANVERVNNSARVSLEDGRRATATLSLRPGEAPWLLSAIQITRV